MSNNKKTTAKKKSSKPKSATAKKKSTPKVKKVEIDVPDIKEVKTLIADTFKQVQADDFKLTETTKKGFWGRIKTWFKVS